MKKEADITELEKGTKAPSLWDMFLVFSKIGAFTIGGGYAMIPLIRDELVKRGWISDEELPDIIALAQSAPGVLAVNSHDFHWLSGQPDSNQDIQRHQAGRGLANSRANDQYGEERE